MARNKQPPKVGILLECGREGLDFHLCRRICALLREQHKADFVEELVPMDNKERLLEECATVAALQLRTGCDRVVILWDEEPAYPDKHKPLCWSHERQRILNSLAGANVQPTSVHLVCIERAIETWLLHDDRLLSAILTRPTHPKKVKLPANPHRISNVKGAMIRLFRQHGHTYVDVTWASRLAANLEDLKKLRRCKTFRRFAERVSGSPI